MTFKHAKFTDSSVMRSLERVAINKGLVKVEEIKKEASNENFKITDNLIINLLNLASGLRNKGLNKYADELEIKILSYKKSLALNKDFDSILDQAHPKGSTKLEDLDHKVKDLLDAHLDMIKSINSPNKVKTAYNKILINKVAQALNLDLGKDKESNQLQFQDTAWISEDGLRCNAKYISEKLEPQAFALNETLKNLNNLKTLASDNRFNPQVSKAVNVAITLVSNLLKDYVVACKNSFSKARELEIARLKNVNDLNQARVSFNEVGSFFKIGTLSKVSIGKSNNFSEVELGIINLKKDLGNLIYNRLSPGFDFDEDFMQSVKAEGFQYLNSIKTLLGS